ncbi:hypothetical protein ACQV5M_22605, partial [Leptospira sp. SA-E8]|uniref:hypothetical protein n=1 Tax=Leptospira sp. SA-E8 TaxID=3422259 RepID=UPI003EB894AB
FEALARAAAHNFGEGGDAQVSPSPVLTHQRPEGQVKLPELLLKQQACLAVALAPRNALSH